MNLSAGFIDVMRLIVGVLKRPAYLLQSISMAAFTK